MSPSRLPLQRRRARAADLVADLAREQGEALVAALVQNASDIIVVLGPDGDIRYVSPSMERVLGHSRASLDPAFAPTLAHPDDRSAMVAAIGELRHRPAGSVVTMKCRARHADGTWRHLEIVGNNLLADPNVEGLVLTARDVSERQALEDQLRHQAFHDSLTGLANRALFANRVEHALIRRARRGEPLAVLFLDLDDFKTVNDTIGHAEGDELLVAVADRLRASLRLGDTAARLGGDEFGVLLDELRGEDEALSVAERILAGLQAPILLQGREVEVGASIGIASSLGVDSADDLLRNADVAMYMAKNEGKNRCITFAPEMHRRIVERLGLRHDLQRALDRGGELHLRYHPIIDLGSSCLAGFEALVRWDHPERGLISPVDFIPLAEETGLIVPLGRWVLAEAAKSARSWQRRHGADLFLTVNLSGRQLVEPGLPGDVARLLSEADLAPDCLVLEITESLLLRDSDAVVTRLRELRGLGVRLAVDDFGTGYSSLAYLRRFPVNILKIDKSFVDHVDASTEGVAVTRAIVDLANGLGLQTIAEGIERAGQATALWKLGCGLGQGYHFARPLTVPEVEDLLAARAA
jgi:diguanylate cyclase (GGDEF)-like protein/PAS domain S-box-containing protein